MTSSRREFLKRGTWMALAAGVPLSLSEKASGFGLTTTPSGSGLSMAAFRSQLDTTFLISHEASKVQVKLVDVKNLASREQTARGKEGFSLRFRSSLDTALPQNTYVIEHEQLGLFSFLIVPIRTKDRRGQYYEAVVNRLYP